MTDVVRYDEAGVARAAALLAAGGVVALPTETVYGLAADAGDGAAVAKIYAAKGRPAVNPLIVHLPDLDAAERVAAFDVGTRALARRFWPGPLTLVLPMRADAGIAGLATAGLPTVAVRVPAHPAFRAVLAACGRPLAAPSANPSGRVSPTRAEHVLAGLGGRIPLVLDAGPTQAGLESTIVSEGAILRPGPITAEMLGFAPAADGSAVMAPGQLPGHYAPAKPLRLDAETAEVDEWLIGFGAVAGDDTLSATGDLAEAAARLFDALHRADAAARVRIAVAPVPADGLGAAINDRLRRAAWRAG
jgi:L-threonylcarbamoyladenylate synthase